MKKGLSQAELLAQEFSPQAAQQAQERAQRPQPLRSAHAQGTPAKRPGKPAQRRTEPRTVAVPLGTRQEVFEALQLLAGDGVVITSINGGKAKRGQ